MCKPTWLRAIVVAAQQLTMVANSNPAPGEHGADGSVNFATAQRLTIYQSVIAVAHGSCVTDSSSGLCQAGVLGACAWSRGVMMALYLSWLSSQFVVKWFICTVFLYVLDIACHCARAEHRMEFSTCNA